METPEHLRYTSEHEWAYLDGTSIKIGITDYAQDALGDVVYVDLPDLGKVFSAGDVFGEIESTKSVSELYVPVGGKVMEINNELEEHPELVNSDPYGRGWLCVFEATNLSDYDSLLDAAGYQAVISAEQ
jgi:glycine cleavage system H protein